MKILTIIVATLEFKLIPVDLNMSLEYNIITLIPLNCWKNIRANAMITAFTTDF